MRQREYYLRPDEDDMGALQCFLDTWVEDYSDGYRGYASACIKIYALGLPESVENWLWDRYHEEDMLWSRLWGETNLLIQACPYKLSVMGRQDGHLVLSGVSVWDDEVPLEKRADALHEMFEVVERIRSWILELYEEDTNG
jgi:hypothetical protein